MQEINTRHASRRPISADLDSMWQSGNPHVSEHMHGGTVFHPAGTLVEYDATPFLEQVRVPVLFIVGEYDFVGPEIVRRHADLTAGARFAVVPGAAHVPQWDDAPATLEIVRTFLREADGRVGVDEADGRRSEER